MTRPCALQLDVYQDDAETIDWSVSTDDGSARPYILAPANYDSQEIDPVTGSASIGTVEVGVVDPNQVAGDKTTGYMTERVGSIRGRRCVLRRYVNSTIGWIHIADGPAGVPRLDESYSAYRWAIRDVREIERKQKAFNDGRSTAVAPFGPIDGFGNLGDDGWLLAPVTASPLVGTYHVNEGSIYGFRVGYVEFDWSAPGVPFANLVLSGEGEEALQSQGDTTRSIVPDVDILWRAAGSDDAWNISRPMIPLYVNGEIPVGVVADGTIAGTNVRALQRIILWAVPLATSTDPDAPFDADSVDGVGDDLEIIVRHRGAASDDLPYYFEGSAGDFLRALYRGDLSGVDTMEPLAPEFYDPAGLNAEAAALAGSIAFDATAVAQLDSLDVLIRETEPADDARDYSESHIYGPSGWIPALDDEGRISPVSRERPTTVTGPAINDSRTEPSPDWNGGEVVVTSIEVSYNRYFVPAEVLGIKTESDGLAIKKISQQYVDADAILTEGDQPQSYDGSAFSAKGDVNGNALPGAETGNLLAQAARYEILARYREGAETMRVRCRRSTVPGIRVGMWCPASISWFPNTETGLRGLLMDAVQVLSVDNSECAWVYLLIEGSAIVAEPGYFDSGEVLSDDAGSGYYDGPEVLSDEPSP